MYIYNNDAYNPGQAAAAGTGSGDSGSDKAREIHDKRISQCEVTKIEYGEGGGGR